MSDQPEKNSSNPESTTVGVVALIINKQKQFLLTQRHQPDSSHWHLKWQFAGGGMEFGETPLQTLARELEEELQVSGRVLFDLPIPATHTMTAAEHESGRARHLLLLGYVVSIDDQQPNVEQCPETAAFQWYNLEDALNLDALPNFEEFILAAHQLALTHQLYDQA